MISGEVIVGTTDVGVSISGDVFGLFSGDWSRVFSSADDSKRFSGLSLPSESVHSESVTGGS